jgi:hypothetical protein
VIDADMQTFLKDKLIGDPMYQTRPAFVGFCCIFFLASLAFATDPPKPIQFESQIEPLAITGTQEVDLNLGNRFCNECLEVEWLIVNPFENKIDWPLSTSSCGCISSVPSSLAIEGTKPNEKASSVVVPFKIKLPSKRETLNRQILFWDAGGTAHLQANIKINIHPIIQLETRTIAVSEDAKVLREIAVSAGSEAIDLEKLTVTVSGAEITSSRFTAANKQSGVLYLELDPQLTPTDTIQSELNVETVCNDVSSYQFMNIRYLHRTALIPKEPTFQIEGDSYRSQFVVRSAGLTEALAKEKSLQAFALDTIDGKEKPIPLEVETTPNASGSTLNKIAISLRSTSTNKQPKPTRIRLRCGDWEHTFTCD